ncbi:6-phospho-alpha-glucosidase [Marinilactibacillus psychrotolerans]|uniref:6-phospho-alpha-glucosidase n=2 Tax=Marinilactibacillus psychrotolerans TaxID=191770 RepID=A0AAV3WX17_9LACT|nr:6-phospho-alpha-glucosidase [Marinilactibacillus psychrotolerans]GEL67343.1 6-phospho-beta-glucosidase [Marinilactibacillus psychrotolerans]GEQ36286.1 6-phospho-alpha-glucosidase [Marinilactibacillus psychrotolerans]SDC93828.1 maltose-6'-phosphate glucosidase [Marinilactibacillus psychrotolerans]SJN33798.1 Maltose-6'-phosphate glucosidase [Marinilactibacillus psychrotolerans 42ea]
MMNKKSKIVLVGGGSTWTPGILKAMTTHLKQFPLEKITLYDIDEERQKVIGEFAKILFKEEAPDVKVSYTTDEKEAYTDVDFVFCQMRTGGFEMRDKDEKIPLQHGVIGQETCGPGGFAYGLRSIRDMEKMVKSVRRFSPDAWILNYTNPAAIVALALDKIFPKEDKVLNICDQPVNLLRSFASLIDFDANDFEPVYFGLNHYGWFTHLYDQTGKDRMPEIKEIILNGGFRPVDAEQRDQSWLDTYAMVEDMLKDFPQYLPNTYLQYYLYPEYKLSKMDPNRTRTDEVREGRETKVFNECRRIVENGTAKDSSVVHNDAHGDMMVEVAASIAHNLRKTYVVMVRNNGIVSNLPNDSMVEVAASLGANGPHPYAVGEIDTFYKGLIESQHAYEKLTVEAYMEESYTKALQALTMNRTVVDAKKARKLLDALIEANKEYWPELN